jgi:hypothetical protein
MNFGKLGIEYSQPVFLCEPQHEIMHMLST